jgi:hypothetical protein
MHRVTQMLFFVFQIGSTLTTLGSTQVILAGGAQARNIFWQVGSSATLGTNSIFKGNDHGPPIHHVGYRRQPARQSAGPQRRRHIRHQHGYRPLTMGPERASVRLARAPAQRWRLASDQPAALK